MREILFRGKQAWNDEWAESEYPFGTIHCGAIVHDFIPETIGQYTGLTDKNGKKIFEGDILVFCKGATHPIKVYWDGLGWKFLRNGKNIQDAFECNTIDHIKFCEIIGNIHDNHELLKGE